MPSLVAVHIPAKAPPLGEFELSGDIQLIGRLAASGCQIVLKERAVSKQHARITAENGRFFVADVGSHNGTLHNGVKLKPHTPTALKPGDRIGICDYVFLFHEGDDIPTGTIEIAQNTRVSPADRLQALMAISADPARAGDLAPLHSQVADTLFGGNLPPLDRIADTLLGVFKQAERCIVLVLDESGRALPKVMKCRGAEPEDRRFCRTLAIKAIESHESYVAETATGSAWPQARSVMCVPLTSSDGRPLGALQLDTRDPTTKFGADDLNLLSIVANLASVAIERARLFETIQAREKQQRELQLAKEVQEGFLPRRLPDVAEYEFYSHYSPAKTVGGDYYDFITLQDGRVAVVVADVSGKGVPAALLVAKLSSDVRTCLLTVPDLAKAVCYLNDQLIQAGVGDKFVTLAAMVIDRVAHTVTIVNAGHPSPKLFRAATGEIEEVISIAASGLPVGVEPQYPYQSVTVSLQPHDTVTAFTDGVTEAMNTADEVFGMGAVEQHLIPDATQGPDSGRPRWVGQSLVDAVRKHTGGRVQNDDIAIVSFGRWEAESEHNTTLVR